MPPAPRAPSETSSANDVSSYRVGGRVPRNVVVQEDLVLESAVQALRTFQIREPLARGRTELRLLHPERDVAIGADLRANALRVAVGEGADRTVLRDRLALDLAGDGLVSRNNPSVFVDDRLDQGRRLEFRTFRWDDLRPFYRPDPTLNPDAPFPSYALPLGRLRAAFEGGGKALVQPRFDDDRAGVAWHEEHSLLLGPAFHSFWLLVRAQRPGLTAIYKDSYLERDATGRIVWIVHVDPTAGPLPRTLRLAVHFDLFGNGAAVAARPFWEGA